MKLHLLPAVTIASALAATLGAQSPSARDEEFARRQYESGLSFMQNKRYDEGVKDFRAIVASFPKSQVADDALLQIALYEFDVAHDGAAAQADVDKLLREYADADSAPMAHVVAGRIASAKSRAPQDVDVALASFERVPRLFPSAAAVPAAGFYAGDTLRAARRLDEAYDRFSRVAMEYPGTVWAARAAIAGAAFLVQSDRGSRAVEGLQRAREVSPGSPEATIALNYNTIIYRLYIRAPAQPAYAFSKYLGSETSKFKDVVGVRVDESGRILLGHKQGIAVFDATSALTRTVAAVEPSAFFVDERGRVVFARRDVLSAETGETTAIVIPPPAPGGKARQVEEIPSAVVRSDGERLIVDRKGKVVIRVSPAGKYGGTFAAVNAERLAINWLDDVAMIDRDSKGIAIVDRDGKAIGKIPAKGTGYELDNPIDLAFDPLGHLYVLDRGRAAILVFGPKNRLITTITFPEKDAGAFPKAQAFSVDAAGRLYVFDDRSQRLQVYQ
jgi:outer membrane protein assembly factor BamD (BamD/ComL family)